MRLALAAFAGCVALLRSTLPAAQTPSQPAADAKPAAAAMPAADPGPLAALAWLAGCWTGSVNGRDFREQWSPLRGNMMIGVGHTVAEGRTQDYEYLRLDVRPDGVFYITLPSGEKEAFFKLTSTQVADLDTIFTFSNSVDAFPQRIVYRRGTEGWLYATVEGKLNGEERRVVYPMRRVGCESGEYLKK